MGLIPWSPLSGGLLAGALSKVEEGRRGEEYMRGRDRGEPRPSSSRGRRCAPSSARTPPHVALAWLLHQPAVTAPIIGPRTEEQLLHAMHALEIKLGARRAREARRDLPRPRRSGARSLRLVGGRPAARARASSTSSVSASSGTSCFRRRYRSRRNHTSTITRIGCPIARSTCIHSGKPEVLGRELRRDEGDERELERATRHAGQRPRDRQHPREVPGEQRGGEQHHQQERPAPRRGQERHRPFPRVAQHLAHDREQPGGEGREHAEPSEHDAGVAADLAGDSGARPPRRCRSTRAGGAIHEPCCTSSTMPRVGFDRCMKGTAAMNAMPSAVPMWAAGDPPRAVRAPRGSTT